jgi:hypothetical protein
MTNDFPTLFFLVTAMLVYRTVDLLCTKEKLEQLASRATWWKKESITFKAWWKNESITFSVIIGAARTTKHNARAVLLHFKILMLIRQEFIAGTMVLYLSLLAMIGYSVMLSEYVRTGNGASLVVAVATALVSLVASLMNYEIEKVKVYL